MTSRVSTKNKEKKGQKEKSAKKETKQGKKRYKETENAFEGVEPGLSARSSNSLTTAPQ